MKKLMLSKGLSYSCRGFSCEKGKPFEAEDSLAEQLLATGRFEEESDVKADTEAPKASDDEPTEGVPETSADDSLTAAKVSQMKNSALVALAKEKGINLDGCSKHDEYVERINGALGLVDFSNLGLE